MATANDPAVEKRTRFFDGQFLQDDDFNVEQAYHLDRQRRHNRLLHLAGVAEGFAVAAEEPNTVTVGPGTAVDSDGRMIVLGEGATVDLPASRFNNQQGIELVAAYAQSPEDRQSVEGSDDFTRWLERPDLAAVKAGEAYGGEAPPVVLATLALDGAGRVTVDVGSRTYSGVRLPGAVADPPSLRTAPTGEVTLAGALTVTDGLRLPGERQLVFSDSGGGHLKVQLSSDSGLGWYDGTLFAAADRRHSWRDKFGRNERMALTTAPDGGLTVLGTGRSTFNGPLRIFRNAQESRGAAWLLELYQDEVRTRFGAGADVYPGIRFCHDQHFETTLEARPFAFHLLANANRDTYASLRAGWTAVATLGIGSFGEGQVGTDAQRAVVDIQAAPRTGSHPDSLPLYVTADLGESSRGVEFRRSDGQQGIGFGYNTIYAAGSDHGQDLNLMTGLDGSVGIGTTTPWKECALDVNGDVRVKNIFVLGSMFFEPVSNWGTEDQFGPRDRRVYWYFRRNNWNVNHIVHGGVEVWPSNFRFPVELQPSDLRLKQNVSVISDALECVSRLRGVRFEWNDAGLRHLSQDIEATTTVRPDATDEENEELWEELRRERYTHLDVPNVGLIAQDVEAVAPELVGTNGDGFKVVDYGRLNAVLVEAVKELAARLATLEHKESSDA